MVKISKSIKDQYRLTIPREVILATKWNEDTEIIFTPLLENPRDKVDKNTTFILKVVEK
jgi:hypothetical protein